MADIKCNICGTMNPPANTICQTCGASLSQGGDSIQPGQMPTRQPTSELEPVLPDWLRNARDASQDQPSPEKELPPSAPPMSAPSAASDLLAGLRAQAEDDDEEIPDWLAGITGAETSKKKPQPEVSGSRRVELGSPSKPEPVQEPEELPSWLSSLSAPQEPVRDELGDWFKQADAAAAPSEAAPARMPSFGSVSEPAPSAETSSADWLSGLQSDSSISAEPTPKDTAPFADVDLPDWLKGEEPSTPAPAASTAMPGWLKSLDSAAPSAETLEPQAPAPDAFETADWLKGLEAATPEPPVAQPAAAFDTPDWLKGMDSVAPESAQSADAFETADWLKGLDTATSEPPAAQPAAEFEAPDWLKGMDSTPEAPAATPAFDAPDWLKGMDHPAPVTPPAEPVAEEAAAFDLPDWLRGAEPASQTDIVAPEPSVPAPSFNVDLPDWLKGAGVVSGEAPVAPTFVAGPSAPSEAPAPAAAAFTDVPADVAGAAMPDWLSNLGSRSSAETFDSFTPETSRPSVIPEEGEIPPEESLPSGDLDSLFTEMPDWLASAASVTAQAPSAEEPDTAISPASLPSWVQAMRPVEAAMDGISGSLPADESLETDGPLAGLHGVLPPALFAAAISKPKPLAVKLQTDDEQQAQSAMLEQILSAEARPEPMLTPSRMGSQRILRIVIGLLLLMAVIVPVFLGTQMVPLPLGRPAETMAAFNMADSLVPPDAPVLVVFDYEPALAAEMEAAAAPLLDHLVVKKHPRLVLLSTSPTGAVLAERMFTGPLGDLTAIQKVNLGYLPGGLGTVRAFAENPSATAALPADLSIFNLNPSTAWQSPLLQDVRSFSNFAAVILITDSAETGRVWIEQAGPLRGSAQFVVVSSAQASPLFQPYYRSGQINGLVSGLYDGAVLEQNNASRPGSARRYWDAYNFSLALVLALITVGALWSLAANLRERMSSREGGQ